MIASILDTLGMLDVLGVLSGHSILQPVTMVQKGVGDRMGMDRGKRILAETSKCRIRVKRGWKVHMHSFLNAGSCQFPRFWIFDSFGICDSGTS